MTTKEGNAPRVALTGAGGFLGWHIRAALLEVGAVPEAIPAGSDFAPGDAVASLEGAGRMIHAAGVNRGSEEEVRDGNIWFAEQIAEALVRAENPPGVVVFANSSQAGNGSVYGESKARAADVLAEAAQRVGAEFIDVRLPNLFGEHGRPFYNSVTATFSHLLAGGRQPQVEKDRELTLMHAQNAADALTGAVPISDMVGQQERETVSGLLRRLTTFAQRYAQGQIPDITSAFDRDLFNTYRSYVTDHQVAIPLVAQKDPRGSFFEVIRTHGGCGQFSFSTTVPGISRGDHFHRRKVERFTVLTGRARISMRRLFTPEVIELDVTGDEPMAIDMPTMWAHRIKNTGSEPLFTSFWTNDLFDPLTPDTITEVV